MLSRRAAIVILLIVLSALILTACAGPSPADAVESYINALAAKDPARVVSLVCADWETEARTEVDSLETVDTEVVDLSCETTSSDGDTAAVDCTGFLDLTYQGEVRSIELNRRTYTVVKQGADWLVCGYQQ